ncbi:MAG: SpaA isopeptide-forming pilin-related protein [Gudongella sp.]|nr:SpaA isopeptide-forming pilin-related protein [Gudongella sp.]
MRAHNKQARFLLTLIVATTMILATFSSFGLATEGLGTGQQEVEKIISSDLEGISNTSPTAIEVEGKCCPKPKEGSITVYKRIKRWDKKNSIDANLNGEEFKINLTGPNGYNEILVINKNGNGDHVTFNNLVPGQYKITEKKLDEDKYSGYYIAQSGNHGVDIGSEVVIPKDNPKNVNRWLINVEKKPAPEPKLCDITVQKVIECETDDMSLAGFEFYLEGDIRSESTKTNSEGQAVFRNMPQGTYEVIEVLTDDQAAIFTPQENVTITCDCEIPKVSILCCPNPPPSENCTAEVTFTNTVTPEPERYSIEIDKQIEYFIQPIDKTRVMHLPFIFELSGGNLTEPVQATRIGLKYTFDNLLAGTYTLKELDHNGYTSSLPVGGLEIILPNEEPGMDGNTFYITVINKFRPEPDKCEVIIQKVIEGDYSLEGFEFELWMDGVKKYEAETTNSDGKATFNNVLPGTYDVVENFTPQQAMMFIPQENVTVTCDCEVPTVSINCCPQPPSSENCTKTVTFINTITPVPTDGKIKVEKRVRENGELVAPEDWEDEFYFTMTGPNGFRKEFRFRSDFTMRTFSKLEYGTYTVTEITVDGYIVDGNPKTVTVDADNKYKQIIFRNTIITEEEEYEDVIIQKIIEGDEEFSFEDESFEFWLKNEGQEYGPISTDEHGVAYFENVLLGEYEVIEVLTMQQANKFSPEEDVSITVSRCEFIPSAIEMAARQVVELPYICNRFEFTNRVVDEDTGILRIIKKVSDRRNSSPSLSGFEFKLYRMVEGEEVEEMIKTTTSSGVIEFSGLVEGEYKLYETNRSNFTEGIGREGKELTLNQYTAPNHLYELEVTNIRNYTRNGDDDEDDEDEPEEEDEPSIVFIPSIIPESTPVIVVEPQSVVAAVEEIVEEVPQAQALPKTGGTDPMLFSGLGAALVGLGLFIRKKKED